MQAEIILKRKVVVVPPTTLEKVEIVKNQRKEQNLRCYQKRKRDARNESVNVFTMNEVLVMCSLE